MWFAAAGDIQTATFFYDDYRFTISYIGKTAQTEFEGLIEALLSTN